jgi:GT2 family glycosyltransferase
MTAPTQIVVSIINYKTPEMTLNCVQSVLHDMQSAPDITVRIVIIDNDSADGSVQIIREWLTAQGPDLPVSLVCSAENLGFSGGHNQGIAAQAGAYYLLLNSDALLRPGFLRAMLETALTHPKAGMISPTIQDAGGGHHHSRFRFHSPASEFIRGACSGPITRLLRRYEVAPDGLDTPDWVSFACVMLNGAMIRDIGPMDQGFFLYFEDAEYCFRAKQAGWDIAFSPKAIAIHDQGGSGPVVALSRARQRLPAYYYSARTRFFFLLYGRRGLWAANMAWTLGRMVAKLRWIAGRAPHRAVSHEAIDIWKNIWNPLGPRFAPWERK